MLTACKDLIDVRAVDSHAHVFESGLPLAPGRRYTPGYDAEVSEYLALLDANGISHGLLVQPSFLGTDNRFLLDAIASCPSRLRGVAVVDIDDGSTDLEALREAGIVGVRLNLLGRAAPDFRDPRWLALMTPAARLGLHVELHCASTILCSALPALLDFEVDIVVDHFGRPSNGDGDAGFKCLLNVAPSQRVWVKLSAPYRLDAGPHGDVAAAVVPLLLDAFGPERLVWGSDWPHTQHESETSFAESFRRLADWVPDAVQRRTILVDTPVKLFGFEASTHHAEALPVASPGAF